MDHTRLNKMDPTQFIAKHPGERPNDQDNDSADQSDTGEDPRSFLRSIPIPSEDWILESFCKNMREVTQNNPESLLQLKEQMRKILEHLHSSQKDSER